MANTSSVRERVAGTIPHSLLRRNLLMHFMQFSQQFGLEAMLRCYMSTPLSHIRVPDVIVVQTPFNRTARYYDGVPLVVIEILSPDDKMKVTLQRFNEYHQFGVPFIIQMDPEERTTHVFESRNFICKELTTLNHGAAPIPFDTAALYASLD